MIALAKWEAVTKQLAPYGKIGSAAYVAFVAIRQAQHPTVDRTGWMLWTAATVSSVLFLVLMVERAPALSLMVYRMVNRGRHDR
ncbi:hypothetical protein AWB69_09086 [Caballeronia udeis]|uniref:Uncharacterized protein n=1 Tax=Caballeronia udeis TaxID=1232866 RepID=A0A158JYF5_9BURK|nr:hypothetical protein AWB69_09086 [Caballeronia udeis]